MIPDRVGDDIVGVGIVVATEGSEIREENEERFNYEGHEGHEEEEDKI